MITLAISLLVQVSLPAFAGVPIFSGADAFGAGATIPVAWGDYDGDGNVDLAVGNYFSQANRLHLGNGDGTFAADTRFGAGSTFAMACADFDNDGDLDMAVGNEGQNLLFVNNGGGSFTQQAEFGTMRTVALAWADSDGDGDVDLAVANWNAQQNALYLNDGGGSFSETFAFGALDTNTIAWGDFDLDGDPDLAVGNGDFDTADQNYLYENTGAGAFTEHALFGEGSTDSVAWADADGDGDLDVAVGNEHTPTQNQLWTNGQSGGGSLRVELVGMFHANGPGFSNRDGIGAIVTVFAAGHLGDAAHRLSLQQAEAKGGFSAQNEMALTFGTTGEALVDVRIAWPGSGGTSITQDIPSVPTGQTLLVVETRPGDATGDGLVGVTDLLVLLGAWGPCPAPPVSCPADFDNDGVVGIVDLLTLLANWTY